MTPEEAKEWLKKDDDYQFDDEVSCDALATIANLRYEYAVQLKHGDGWITSRHHTPTVEVAKEVAARYKRSETRIVRHLATDWEVTS